MLACIIALLCSFISLKSHIIIPFMSKILYRVTVLCFQLKEVSLKWCKEGWQIEVICSVSIMRFRWECQNYLLINQLHELSEIIYSACTYWNNILYVGERKTTTKINKCSVRICDRPWRGPWEKQGNNSLVPCCIQKGKFTLFLSEAGSYSVSALRVNSASFPSFKCWASFGVFDKPLLNNSHQCAEKTHISRRKKSHGSSSTWTSAKITSYK